MKFYLRKIIGIALCVIAISGCDDDPVAPVETPAPAPPTNLTATTLNHTSVRLDWTASATSLDSISSYLLSISGRSDTIIISRTTSTYNVTGLSAGTPYTFTLRTKGQNGKFSTAATAQAETSPEIIPAPAMPTNLRATSVDYQTVRLKWVASVSANEIDFANYELIATPAGGSAIPLIIIAKDKTTYDVTGLTEGTIYSFSLKAKNTSEKFSQKATVQWSPATRIIAMRLYETASSQFGNGIELSSGEVLKTADAARWDIALDTRTINGNISFEIGSPNLLSYTIPGGGRKTSISSKIYENTTSLNDVFDTDAFSNTSMDAPRIVSFTSVTQGFLFFAKTENGNYAKILVKAVDVKILQGTAPNRYVEMDISYQSAPNVPYARTENTQKPSFKTIENSLFRKWK